MAAERPVARQGRGRARVRVVLAEDHPVYREGLGHALRGWPEIELVGEAQAGPDALEQIRAQTPDVALLDLKLPQLDGLRVLDAVKRAELPTEVLFISGYDDSETVFRAFSQGARGFLPKHATAQEICEAILTVASGGAVIPPHHASGLAAEIHKRRERDEQPLLTERELEILRRSSEGLSVREVAESMHLAVATVKTHLQHAYEKLEVNDRTAAVAKAMRRGWLD